MQPIIFADHRPARHGNHLRRAPVDRSCSKAHLVCGKQRWRAGKYGEGPVVLFKVLPVEQVIALVS